MVLLAFFAASASAGERPKVLVALGDSTTAGTPYDRERPDAAYPARLERLLPGWKVVNRGVAGERTDQIRARLKRDVLALRPRTAIVLAGVNDIYQGVPPDKVRANLKAMYRELKAAGVAPVAASVLPYDAALPDDCRALQALNLWIEGEAARQKIAFADLHAAAASPRDPCRLKGSPDGLHPDPATYAAVAEAAARALTPASPASPGR
ncbi:MAG TPA: GDSL-type esterase/lipase family protein [Elusimicrobiota bacterium]|nr:GDSL-type esterase/lipase family protein [Elusimicrobiota bacterium]